MARDVALSEIASSEVDVPPGATFEIVGEIVQIDSSTEGMGRLEFEIPWPADEQPVGLVWRETQDDSFAPVLDAYVQNDKIVAHIDHFSQYALVTWDPEDAARRAEDQLRSSLAVFVAETRAEFPSCTEGADEARRSRFAVAYVGPVDAQEEPRLFACVARRVGADDGTHLLEITNNRAVSIEARVPDSWRIRENSAFRDRSELISRLIAEAGDVLAGDRHRTLIISHTDTARFTLPADLPTPSSISFEYTNTVLVFDLLEALFIAVYGTLATPVAAILEVVKLGWDCMSGFATSGSLFEVLAKGTANCLLSAVEHGAAIRRELGRMLGLVLDIVEVRGPLFGTAELVADGSVFGGAGTITIEAENRDPCATATLTASADRLGLRQSVDETVRVDFCADGFARINVAPGTQGDNTVLLTLLDNTWILYAAGFDTPCRDAAAARGVPQELFELWVFPECASPEPTSPVSCNPAQPGDGLVPGTEFCAGEWRLMFWAGASSLGWSLDRFDGSAWQPVDTIVGDEYESVLQLVSSNGASPLLVEAICVIRGPSFCIGDPQPIFGFDEVRAALRDAYQPDTVVDVAPLEEQVVFCDVVARHEREYLYLENTQLILFESPGAAEHAVEQLVQLISNGECGDNTLEPAHPLVQLEQGESHAVGAAHFYRIGNLLVSIIPGWDGANLKRLESGLELLSAR